MNKLLTLAVPTYNMEKYLARCLDSVLCENQDLLEVLVVNDGSKDRSSAIGHEYAAKYPNSIRVIDKENGNYGSCVNRALEEATGKYFRMLDSDDWCDTDALNRLLEQMKTCDADMVLTISEDRKDGKIIRRMEAPCSVQPGKIYEMDDFDGIALDYHYLFCSHIITYKTEILRTIGLKLQHGISYTDNEYVYFPMSKCTTAVYYDFPVYQYFIGREGQTTDFKVVVKSVGQIMQVLNRLLDDFEAHKAERSIAICNNQRILLDMLISWVYSCAFSRFGFKLQSIIDNLEIRLNKDETLKLMLQSHQINISGFDAYRYYIKTGRYVNHPITMMHYFPRLFWQRLFKRNH